MKWIERFDLFLFDLDGLLINTEELHFRAYRQMCASFGFDLNWSFIEFCAHAHIDSTHLRRAIYRDLPQLYEKHPDFEVLYQEKQSRYLKLLQDAQVKLLPGAETLLKQLALLRIKRCVVTNATKQQTAMIKKAIPLLNSIPVWITREDYERGKPEPDGYLKALELLADSDDRTVGFEDTYRGLRALKKTRAKPVLICDPKHPQLEAFDFSDICHFSSLKAIPSSFG